MHLPGRREGLAARAVPLGDPRHRAPGLRGDLGRPSPGGDLNLSDWPFTLQRSSELLSAYLFLLLGAAGHVVVNMLKKDRAENASTRGLADWLLRVHVKETSFWASAATLSLAPLAMAFLFKSVDWKTAFFFGYSYDSFIDLFLQRFEGMASSATESIKKKL